MQLHQQLSVACSIKERSCHSVVLNANNRQYTEQPTFKTIVMLPKKGINFNAL